MGAVETITLLQAQEGYSTAKVISPAGVQSYDAGKYFKVIEVQVSNIRDVADVLTEASDPLLRMLVIRGKLRPEGVEVLARDPSTLVLRRKTVFMEQPRRWLCTDFDGVRVDVPVNLAEDPESAVRAVVRLYLPEYFQDTSFFWQLSSRAGLESDPQLVKVHLWWFLDRPLSDAEAAAWAEACAPEVDTSLFRVVQPHYIANPVFEGMADPLSRRLGSV